MRMSTFLGAKCRLPLILMACPPMRCVPSSSMTHTPDFSAMIAIVLAIFVFSTLLPPAVAKSGGLLCDDCSQYSYTFSTAQ